MSFAWDRDTEQWRARLARFADQCRSQGLQLAPPLGGSPTYDVVVRQIEGWLRVRRRCDIELECCAEVRAFGAEVYEFVKKRAEGDRAYISWYRAEIVSTRTACLLSPYKVLDYHDGYPRGAVDAKEVRMTRDMLAVAEALRGAGFEVGFMEDEILNDEFRWGHLHVYACADLGKLANVRRWTDNLDPVSLWVRLPEAERQSCRCGEGCIERPKE